MSIDEQVRAQELIQPTRQTQQEQQQGKQQQQAQQQPQLPNPYHQDFGEKIGGARKDLWRERGLYTSDLDIMNERETEKYVKKDNIWKKPDYQVLLESGVPLAALYYIKLVRDSISASPSYNRSDDTPEKKHFRQKEYVETVRQIESVMMSIQTIDDALQAMERFAMQNGYAQLKEPAWLGDRPYSLTEAGRANTTITDKLMSTLYIPLPRDFERIYTRSAQKEQFGVPKEDKVPAGFALRYNDGKNTWSKNESWQPNTWYITKGHRIVADNLPTREDALRLAQTLAAQKRKKTKERFVPPQLAHIRRDGPDYRNGQAIIGEHYLDTFGFRGGEFGNWLNQKDRQASLDMGFEALKDLANALHISDKDIALQNTLSIAFGARGIGKALAHYEPLRKVINLTKMRGAGSLAHEWWHALDDYLGSLMGAKGFLSEQPRLYPLMQKLIETIQHKPETLEQAIARREHANGITKKDAELSFDRATNGILQKVQHQQEEKNHQDAQNQENQQDLQKQHDLHDPQAAQGEAILAQYDALKQAFLAGEIGTVGKINELKKTITGRVIPKEERETLLVYERALHNIAEQEQNHELPEINTIPTDFYIQSKQMSKRYEKDGGYWESNIELTARAFACYVQDKLPYLSDYLVGHAESVTGTMLNKDGSTTVLYAYPRGEERAAINAVFDEIIADLKLQHIFTHEEVIQPLAISVQEKEAKTSQEKELQKEEPQKKEHDQLSLDMFLEEVDDDRTNEFYAQLSEAKRKQSKTDAKPIKTGKDHSLER